jgi:hypothetical protein
MMIGSAQWVFAHSLQILHLPSEAVQKAYLKASARLLGREL